MSFTPLSQQRYSRPQIRLTAPLDSKPPLAYQRTAMNVQLYVYDLSNGLASAVSFSLLGVQIDAVYHTGIVMGNIEYVYDGGIKTVSPGKTHLGQPKQILELGTTNLPMDVIMEYLDSLKQVYTAEVCLFSSERNNS